MNSRALGDGAALGLHEEEERQERRGGYNREAFPCWVEELHWCYEKNGEHGKWLRQAGACHPLQHCGW
ncbi:hypothetical protein HYH02_015317 [Chlamydomonas schloesseri]|uniref:Uncharacterized protein n=1 Tax=Chlamydomonas schloesseri TaxID=2026947 RepID=A0A835SP69_9CHLO|nr:hypothetical protein HYH02_015317 [Chlamydomonas schloesseri]|eukprot:KAG2423486.1 hypothetical protein HYH02_015317 [Chlamydomonas schloesseri]